MNAGEFKGSSIESIRRVNGKKGSKCGSKDLFCFRRQHRRLEPAKGDAEEFLYDLKTNDALSRFQRVLNQTARNGLFRRNAAAHLINEDIGVKEESIVHSFRRACKDPWN